MAARKTPTCACCGEPRVKGHSAACGHPNRTCAACLRTRGLDTAVGRAAALEAALAALGLQRRSDSAMCSAFVAGAKDALSLGPEGVALVAARMRYLYEGHCPAFNARVGKVEEEVERLVGEIARDEGRHYTGIYRDAYREVYGNGFYSAADVRRDLAQAWTAWPQSWPWAHAR